MSEQTEQKGSGCKVNHGSKDNAYRKKAFLTAMFSAQTGQKSHDREGEKKSSGWSPKGLQTAVKAGKNGNTDCAKQKVDEYGDGAVSGAQDDAGQSDGKGLHSHRDAEGHGNADLSHDDEDRGKDCDGAELLQGKFCFFHNKSPDMFQNSCNKIVFQN